VIETHRREVVLQAADGTVLFADDRGPPRSKLTTVLCLPGLTRNSKDFEPVFELLSGERRVIAMDLRGRGRSGYVSDSKSYTPNVELADVIGLLDHLALKDVAVIGTSRGGLIGQIMAATHKSRLAGLLLNDIGAEINPRGLKRILGYLGEAVSFASWRDAAIALSNQAPGFSGVSEEQWITAAKRVYTECSGRPCTDYDMRLSEHSISNEDIDAGKVANLWSIVPALRDIPVTILRGAGSDILDVATVKRMMDAVPEMAYSEIPNRGHVPFLDEPESVLAIRKWLRRVDAKEKGR
jgi:pimeloyl-ACP methyl ester carboxylesterase